MIRIDLRRLILWISLLSIMLVLAGGLHASYLVQRDLLLHNAQEDNRAYASKLAATTEYFLNDLRRYLAFSAEMLADMQAHPELMAEETRRQETQLGHFNSSFIVSPQGKVLSASASVPDLLGRQMHSTAAQDAIQTQRPTISEPFQGRSGRWLILYTHPIFSADKRYIGYIAGTLYLHQDNVLDRLLGQHFHRDDSVLRVMDRNGTLIYDRDRSMLGKPAAELQALAPAARRDGRIALRRRSRPRHAGRLCAGAEHGLEPHRTATGGGHAAAPERPAARHRPQHPASAAVVHRVALAAVQADRQAAGRTCRLRQAHAGPGFRRRHTRRALLVLRGDPAQARTTDGPGVHAPQDARPAPQERHRHVDRPAQPPRPGRSHGDAAGRGHAGRHRGHRHRSLQEHHDRYGHAAGDRALQRLAKQMADSARASDTRWPARAAKNS